jgi:hypothetical protein
MAGRISLNRDFCEFIECCVAHEVRFLVVGGYAVAAHGHPRFTKDLDVWVWVDEHNARGLLAALSDFGFGSVGLTHEDFLEPNTVVQLGYPPKRIDLLTSIDGVNFDECDANRVEFELPSGTHVPFISLEDLRANKRATGRLQDLADLEALED